jgi:hypothetical protein
MSIPRNGPNCLWLLKWFATAYDDRTYHATRRVDHAKNLGFIPHIAAFP